MTAQSASLKSGFANLKQIRPFTSVLDQ